MLLGPNGQLPIECFSRASRLSLAVGIEQVGGDLVSGHLAKAFGTLNANGLDHFAGILGDLLGLLGAVQLMEAWAKASLIPAKGTNR